MIFPDRVKNRAKLLAPFKNDLHKALAKGDEVAVIKLLGEACMEAREKAEQLLQADNFCGTPAEEAQIKAIGLMRLYERLKIFISENK